MKTVSTTEGCTQEDTQGVTSSTPVDYAGTALVCNRSV